MAMAPPAKLLSERANDNKVSGNIAVNITRTNAPPGATVNAKVSVTPSAPRLRTWACVSV
jgi:hypothetical protein